MDVMGQVRLRDGTELSVVTGIDDHARFCASALLVPKAAAKPVCRALTEAMRRYGIPDAVLTDIHTQLVPGIPAAARPAA